MKVIMKKHNNYKKVKRKNFRDYQSFNKQKVHKNQTQMNLKMMKNILLKLH